MLQLPPSETDRAFLFGFSHVRLLMLFITLLGILFFVFLFITSVKSSFIDRLVNNTFRYFSRNYFNLAILIVSLILLFIGGFVINILLNPSIFSLAKIYRYIYDRIQWQFIWATWICGELFVIFWILFWDPISRNSISRTTQPNDRIVFILSLLAAILMGILWILYAQNPATFMNRPYLIKPFLLLSLVLVILPVLLQSKNHKLTKIDESNPKD